MLIRRYILILAALFMFAAPATADVFQVRDLKVDETGATGQQARDKAWAQAKYRGAQLLLERLTLPEDRAAASQPIQISDLARFGTKFDRQVQDKLTATRYIGVLAYTFDAKSVRDYLDARGVPFVESQAGKALLLPIAGGALDAVAWAEVWKAGANDTILTPYEAPAAIVTQRPGWQDVSGQAASVGANRAIVAEGYPQAGGIMVRLTELRAGQADAVIGTLGPFPDAAAAQAAAIRDMETKWKQATVVRTSGVTAMSVVAGFRDINDWIRIRKAMEGSRIIRDIKVESLSAVGADISFMHSGRPDQVAGDLRSRGVILKGGEGSWMLEAAGDQ